MFLFSNFLILEKVESLITIFDKAHPRCMRLSRRNHLIKSFCDVRITGASECYRFYKFHINHDF